MYYLIYITSLLYIGLSLAFLPCSKTQAADIDFGNVLIGAASIQPNVINLDTSKGVPRTIEADILPVSDKFGNEIGFGFTGKSLSLVDSATQSEMWIMSSRQREAITFRTSNPSFTSLGIYFAPSKLGSTSATSTYITTLQTWDAVTTSHNLKGNGIADNAEAPTLTLDVTATGKNNTSAKQQFCSSNDKCEEWVVSSSGQIEFTISSKTLDPEIKYVLVKLFINEVGTSNCTLYSFQDTVLKQDNFTPEQYFDNMSTIIVNACFVEKWFLTKVNESFTINTQNQLSTGNGYVQYHFNINGHTGRISAAEVDFPITSWAASQKVFRLRTGTVTPPTTTNPKLTVEISGTGSVSSNSPAAGIDCPTICSANFPQSQTVSLTAKPTSPNNSVKWGNACPDGKVTLGATDVVCNVTFSQSPPADSGVTVTITLGENMKTITAENSSITCSEITKQCVAKNVKDLIVLIPITTDDTKYTRKSWTGNDCDPQTNPNSAIYNTKIELKNLTKDISCTVTAQAPISNGLQAILSPPTFKSNDSADGYSVTLQASTNPVREDVVYSIKVFEAVFSEQTVSWKPLECTVVKPTGADNNCALLKQEFSLGFNSNSSLDSTKSYLISLTATIKDDPNQKSNFATSIISPALPGFVDFEYASDAERVSLEPVKRLQSNPNLKYSWWCDNAACKYDESSLNVSSIKNMKMTAGSHSVELIAYLNGILIGKIAKQIDIPINYQPQATLTITNDNGEFKLDASNSKDPDGGALTYQWSKNLNSGGKAINICTDNSSANTCSYSLTPEDIDELQKADSPSLTFGVTVNDDDAPFTNGTPESHSSSITKILALTKLQAVFTLATTDDGKSFLVNSTPSQPSKFELQDESKQSFTGNTTTIIWKKGKDVATPTDSKISFEQDGDGKHSIILSIRDSFGFFSETTRDVLVKSLEPAINASCSPPTGCNIVQTKAGDLFSGALFDGQGNMLALSPEKQFTENPASVMISINPLASDLTATTSTVDTLLVIGNDNTEPLDGVNAKYYSVEQNNKFSPINLYGEPGGEEGWLAKLQPWETSGTLSGNITIKYEPKLEPGSMYYIFAGYRRLDGSIVYSKGPVVQFKVTDP